MMKKVNVSLFLLASLCLSAQYTVSMDEVRPTPEAWFAACWATIPASATTIRKQAEIKDVMADRERLIQFWTYFAILHPESAITSDGMAQINKLHTGIILCDDKIEAIKSGDEKSLTIIRQREEAFGRMA